MDSAARRQKLLETTGFEPAFAVTVCGKLKARCLVSSSRNSGSGISPGPQAVLASIAIKHECLHALSQPDRNQLLRRFPELPVDEIGCQAAHQRELFGLTRPNLQGLLLE
jgi:hypothetical protein